jgi:putative transposase
MSDYRRAIEAGGMFFFTLVTHQRRQLFTEARARGNLRQAISEVRERWPFEIVAVVVLPEHLHSIWRLPEGDTDYSTRWACIKKRFTALWTMEGGIEGSISATRKAHREHGVWQRRYWEHRIRDEKDMIHHVNYIHYNPVKHGLVRCPHNWPYSSFHRWVKDGYYRVDWLCDCAGGLPEPPDFTDLRDTTGE